MNPQTNLTSEFPVRVLIVDDHPTTAHTLARAVSQMGPKVDVVSATSGREALERVEGSAADILITDMIMPEMNGLELVEKLQRHPGGKPAHVILITAYDVPGLKETARRAKVDEIIVKPVRPERICQIVSGLLDEWSRSTPRAKEKPDKKPFKILIADDRPDNVTLLCRYIENEGYAYITASDGEETLIRTREHMPDLVLLDINMPKKDGFAVLEEIRHDPALQHIPVIILTAARIDPHRRSIGVQPRRRRLRDEALRSPRTDGAHPHETTRERVGGRDAPPKSRVEPAPRNRQGVERPS